MSAYFAREEGIGGREGECGSRVMHPTRRPGVSPRPDLPTWNIASHFLPVTNSLLSLASHAMPAEGVRERSFICLFGACAKERRKRNESDRKSPRLTLSTPCLPLALPLSLPLSLTIEHVHPAR